MTRVTGSEPALEVDRVAVIVNGRARQVTRDLVQVLDQIVQSGDLFVSRDLEEADRIAHTIVERGYHTVLTGGGDGTFVQMVTRIVALSRELDRKPPNGAGDMADLIELPIVGRVAAGALMEAIETPEDSVKVDRMLIGNGKDVFGLRIAGDSMIEAGIHDNDYVFVRKQSTAERGDIVVALIGDEATVKRFFPEKDYIRFQPENESMAPILVRASDFKPTMLLGVVVGVYRRL